MVKKITDFEITIDQDNVMLLMDCGKDSNVYPRVVEELEEILEEAYQRIEPVALLAIGQLGQFEDKIEGIKASRKRDEFLGLYVMKSIGRRISEWSTQCFEEGDYLKGMLVDAVADDYLFQMNETLKPVIVEMCLERGYGVERRLEAPHDLPMSVQRKGWELTKAKELAGIDIKESFMLDPVKSTCKVFLLKENSKEFHVDHDCSTCPNLTCKLRKT